MTTYAEPEDLEVRFPRALTDAEAVQAPTLLADASFWLSVWVLGLEDAIAAGDEKAAEAAKLLVVAMVRRSLNAPSVDDGVASTTQVAGPFQNVVSYRNPDGSLYLYSKELDAIESLLRPGHSDAVSVMAPGL